MQKAADKEVNMSKTRLFAGIVLSNSVNAVRVPRERMKKAFA
jgi:hypothetical protein